MLHHCNRSIDFLYQLPKRGNRVTGFPFLFLGRFVFHCSHDQEYPPNFLDDPVRRKKRADEFCEPARRNDFSILILDFSSNCNILNT